MNCQQTGNHFEEILHRVKDVVCLGLKNEVIMSLSFHTNSILVRHNSSNDAYSNSTDSRYFILTCFLCSLSDLLRNSNNFWLFGSIF